MTIQYRAPAVTTDWASTRNTDMAVAVAIHAIASHDRTPEAIWGAPTGAEYDHVAMAVENYVNNGVFEPQTGGYNWGQETVILP